MCEKEPKRRSCTECPQYDGMKCTATDFTLGPRDDVLQQEHRRGFICLDTGDAELRGDAVLQWTAEQERLCQVRGYKSVEEMWAAEGKQVKSGFRIDEGNEHLEPVLQVSDGPGPVKLTFQYEENAKPASLVVDHDSGIQYIANPPPLFTHDLFEPRKKSCLLCKHYTEPACDACNRIIGIVQELYLKEETFGFHCYATDN